MVGEIIFCTDAKLPNKRLEKAAIDTIVASGLPIRTLALKKDVPIGKNINLNASRAHTTLYMQLLLGLLTSEADYVFFCEHDVLYHSSHFDFIPPSNDRYYYNNNVWKYRLSDRKVVGYDCHWLSQLCASRELLIDHYVKRFKRIFDGHKAYGYEPGTGQSKSIDDTGFGTWRSEYPNIDVRHGDNWTGVKRMDPSEFKNKDNCQNWKEIKVEDIPGWDKELLLSL